MTQKKLRIVSRTQRRTRNNPRRKMMVHYYYSHHFHYLPILPSVPSMKLLVPADYSHEECVDLFKTDNQESIIPATEAQSFTSAYFAETARPLIPETTYEVILEQFLQRDGQSGHVLIRDAMLKFPIKHGPDVFFAGAQGMALVDGMAPLFYPDKVMIVSPCTTGKIAMMHKTESFPVIETSAEKKKDGGGQKKMMQHIVLHHGYSDGPVPEKHYFLLFKKVK